jgi:hypothetical protein
VSSLPSNISISETPMLMSGAVDEHSQKNIDWPVRRRG